MLALFEDHIALTETPEMQNLYRRVYDLFSLYDWDHVNEALEDMLVSDATVGTGVADNVAIYNYTLEMCQVLLREHGLQLAEDAHLRDYADYMEFIKEIENTSLLNECMQCLENEDMDNEEKFAQIVEFVIGRNIEATIEMVHNVPNSVLISLKQYFEGRLLFEKQTEDIDPKYERICKEMDLFARTINGQEMASYKHLFKDNGIIGMEFSFYWTRYQEYLLTLAPQDLVYECIGFALLSEDGMNNPQKLIMDRVNAAFGNLETVTEIQNTLVKTLIEYRNKVSSGVVRTE